MGVKIWRRCCQFTYKSLYKSYNFCHSVLPNCKKKKMRCVCNQILKSYFKNYNYRNFMKCEKQLRKDKYEKLRRKFQFNLTDSSSRIINSENIICETEDFAIQIRSG